METSVISTAGRSQRRRRLARVGPLGALLAVALVLSGCLSSGYTYISHANPDGTIVYFELPSSWTQFTYPSALKAVNGALSQSQVSQIQGDRWYVSFSAATHAKPNLFSNLGASKPQGVAFVAALNATVRDSFSLAAMRAEILGQDPLAASSNSPFNVLSYTEFTGTGGIRGSKLVTDITASNGLTDTFAQIVEVDPQTNYVFALAIGCRASCWGPNEGTIDQILNHWVVKETRP